LGLVSIQSSLMRDPSNTELMHEVDMLEATRAAMQGAFLMKHPSEMKPGRFRAILRRFLNTFRWSTRFFVVVIDPG